MVLIYGPSLWRLTVAFQYVMRQKMGLLQPRDYTVEGLFEIKTPA